MSRRLSRYVSWANAIARYCSLQLSVRTRLSPSYRAMIRPKVFHGRKSINWAKSVLPVFIGDSREDPGSMLRLQIVDTGFCAETRITPGVQSGRPSVNRTAMGHDRGVDEVECYGGWIA